MSTTDKIKKLQKAANSPDDDTIDNLKAKLVKMERHLYEVEYENIQLRKEVAALREQLLLGEISTKYPDMIRPNSVTEVTPSKKGEND